MGDVGLNCLYIAGIPESLHLQCVEHRYLLQQDAGMDVHEFDVL